MKNYKNKNLKKTTKMNRIIVFSTYIYANKDSSTISYPKTIINEITKLLQCKEIT